MTNKTTPARTRSGKTVVADDGRPRKSNIENTASREDRAEAKNRARRKLRDAAEKPSGLLSRLFGGGRDDESQDDHGARPRALMENVPTYVTPSFVTHNGKYLTIVELYNRAGSNREMYYDEILDMIPVDSRSGVDMHLLVADTSIKGDEKKKIIRRNAQSGKGVIRNSAVAGAKEDMNNRSRQIAEMSDAEDYDAYEEQLDSADPIVVFSIRLVVVGPDPETVEDQIEDLNRILDQRHEGARWDSLGGDQLYRFTHLLSPVPEDRFHMTSTAENYAGINFSVNAGLNDPAGLPVGRDALSLSGASSFFDMDGSLKKQAIVAIPRSAEMSDYYMEGDERPPSAASIFSQYAANHAVMNGHRVHHFVLNDFNYLKSNTFYRPWIDGIFERYDVSKVTINPLQGFGDVENVVAIYNRLTQKIVNIFNVLNNLKLTENQRAVILQAVSSFYFSQKLFNDDAERFPGRTRIVGITRPETYPTMGTMINEFTTLTREALDKNQELKSQDVETLGQILRQSLSANRGILGRPTSIKPPEGQQVYYDFSTIESSNIRQVQFLNMIDYVNWTARKGDLVVIHGMEHLWTEVADMVTENILSAQNKGVRFLYSFDTISSDKRGGIKRADMFDMQEKYYKDLDVDVDWSVVGKCLPGEVDAFEAALATDLSPMIRSRMQAKSTCQALVHRRDGDVNNFVHLQVVV